MARRFGSIKPTQDSNYIGRYRIKGKDLLHARGTHKRRN